MSQSSTVRVGCPAHKCGGHGLLIAHVENGRITRLDTDNRPDSLAAPQLRACPRGRAYLRHQYHPDRLLHPLRRTGKRGNGEFESISWDEALNTIAAQFGRVKSAYSNEALFVPYGTGSYNQLNGSHTVRRLLNLYKVGIAELFPPFQFSKLVIFLLDNIPFVRHNSPCVAFPGRIVPFYSGA